MSDFVHLHLHSEYSLLDGACRVREIPAAAKAAGQSAVALTDHGNLFGAVAFYDACKSEGVKPIIGCEVYVAPHDRRDKSGYTAAADKYYHLVLLCENETGYRNLIKLVSAGYTEGFYMRPRIDLELLASHKEGLIALSGCAAGYPARAITRGDLQDAEAHIRYLSALMGAGNYYIELQDHHLPDDAKLVRALLSLSEKTGVPTVCTNDVHYLRREDADTQQLLNCIGTASSFEDGRPDCFLTDEFYLKTADEMAALSPAFAAAMRNTVAIADRCNFDFTFGKLHLPTFPLPAGTSAKAELTRLAEEGLRTRREKGELDLVSHTEDDYKYRMIYEMLIIEKMGYCDYYLIVRDFVTHAKEMGIPTGPGRGSGAGSLVAYLVGITEIDSIRYDLLFERFLNPERVSMPDFDVDFCYDRRDEVIEYVTEKYGRDHVSQIAAFGTLAARAAVRDVGRALGIGYNETDRVAAMIPRDLGITIAEAIRKTPELRAAYENEPETKRLLDFSMAVEGMPRHVSTHAAGIVITEKPLDEYLPVLTNGDAVLTQFDMLTVEKLGLLKFDFLALRYLTIIADTEKIVRASDPSFSVEKLPLDDADSFALISAGDTEGLFQLESTGMKRLLTSMRPSRIEDIMIAIALYRPGPMDSIPKYLKNRALPGSVHNEIAEVEEILKDTSGCIIYQEQVMQIFRKVAGYSYGKADVVRRAMAKKHPEELEKQRVTFLAGAKNNRIPEDAANRLFDEMAGFASYAFNKSHAAAYSCLCYRTAYLKAHYRAAYFSALLSSVLGNPVKTAAYIADCEKAGIRVLMPDINESDNRFSVSRDGNIRFGLGGIKNVGEAFAAAVCRERKQNGRFISFEDFIRRAAGLGLNRQSLASMVWAGCFDGMGKYRSQLLESVETLLSCVAGDTRRNIEGQTDLFNAEGLTDALSYDYPDIAELPLGIRLAREKEMTGLCFSGHLMEEYRESVKELRPTPISDLFVGMRDRQTVTVCGVITAISVKQTKKGEDMAFVTVSDGGGVLEILFFADLFARTVDFIRADAAITVTGQLSARDDDAPKLLAATAALLDTDEERVRRRKDESQRKQGRPAALYLRVPSMTDPKAKRAVAFTLIFEGSTPLLFYSEDTKQYTRANGGVGVNDFVLRELGGILGEENVVYR